MQELYITLKYFVMELHLKIPKVPAVELPIKFLGTLKDICIGTVCEVCEFLRRFFFGKQHKVTEKDPVVKTRLVKT